MITINADSFTGVPSLELVRQVCADFEKTLARLNKLHRYYRGNHDILARQRLAGLPNVKIAHGFPSYIAQVSAAYLLGEPVRVEGPEPATSRLAFLMSSAQYDSVDAEIAINQAVYGRGVSLCYENRRGEPLITSLDPRCAFIVYDDTVAHTPLFAVHFIKRDTVKHYTVYTEQSIFSFSDRHANAHRPAQLAHPFKSLPMAEYLNGHEARGDFEDVITLIDAYDILQCDRLNDRQQFSDALLVLTGIMSLGGASGDAADPWQRLRQEKTLTLPDSDSKAEWLIKDPQERDIDILRRSLVEDIHKFSLTPDFSDERFAGNASGIAIKYKLFNFDNRIKLKERYFTTGLRERARALCGWLATRQGVELDADELTFKMSRRLPLNELERSQAIRNLNEIIPIDTLVFNSPLPPDPAKRKE